MASIPGRGQLSLSRTTSEAIGILYEPPPGNVTQQLLRRLLHFVLPAPCLGCAAPVWEPRDSLGLCPRCRRRLVRWPAGCDVCGRPIAGGRPTGERPPSRRCGECRRRRRPYRRLLSAWSYQHPADAVLVGLKFGRLEYLGGHLGRRLGELFQPRVADCDLVVPVPLHWRRRLTRGYNQAAAIARPLGRALELPVAPLLRRRRATPPQSRLHKKERRKNLRRAFAVYRPGRCRGRRVLLVDDVVTTGATLEAAARCLRRAGARSVTALTAARTPTKQEALLLPKTEKPAETSQVGLLGGWWG